MARRPSQHANHGGGRKSSFHRGRVPHHPVSFNSRERDESQYADIRDRLFTVTGTIQYNFVDVERLARIKELASELRELGFDVSTDELAEGRMVNGGGAISTYRRRTTRRLSADEVYKLIRRHPYLTLRQYTVLLLPDQYGEGRHGEKRAMAKVYNMCRVLIDQGRVVIDDRAIIDPETRTKVMARVYHTPFNKEEEAGPMPDRWDPLNVKKPTRSAPVEDDDDVEPRFTLDDDGDDDE